jgi:hypothetical protein
MEPLLSLPPVAPATGRRHHSLRWLAAVVGLALLYGVWNLWQDHQLMVAAQRALREAPPATLADRDRRLQVCVKAAGGAEIDEARALLATQFALQKAATSSKWRRFPMSGLSPIAELNCPDEPWLDRYRPNAVEQPSKYRIIIFVLPESDIQRLFPGALSSARSRNQEDHCDNAVRLTRAPVPPDDRGDVNCIPITNGIYLAPAEVVQEGVVFTSFQYIFRL